MLTDCAIWSWTTLQPDWSILQTRWTEVQLANLWLDENIVSQSSVLQVWINNNGWVLSTWITRQKNNIWWKCLPGYASHNCTAGEIHLLTHNCVSPNSVLPYLLCQTPDHTKLLCQYTDWHKLTQSKTTIHTNWLSHNTHLHKFSLSKTVYTNLVCRNTCFDETPVDTKVCIPKTLDTNSLCQKLSLHKLALTKKKQKHTHKKKKKLCMYVMFLYYVTFFQFDDSKNNDLMCFFIIKYHYGSMQMKCMRPCACCVCMCT